MPKDKDDSKSRHPKTEIIINMMEEYGLSRRDLEEMAEVSSHAVSSWLRPQDNVSFREPPNNVISLIRMKCNHLYEL